MPKGKKIGTAPMPKTTGNMRQEVPMGKPPRKPTTGTGKKTKGY